MEVIQNQPDFAVLREVTLTKISKFGFDTIQDLNSHVCSIW